MNPRLYQSVKLLELPVMDLRTQIEIELERNPALEIIEDNSTVPLDESETRQKEENEDFDISSDYEKRGSGRTSDEHQQFMEGALTRPATLQEHLLEQLQIEPADKELRNIAQTLIQNLDDDGFHIEKPETLFPCEEPRLKEAMELVRGLDPAGTCTNDYHESLKVQLKFLDDAPKGIEKILDNLELLKKEKYSQLEKITGMKKDDIYHIDEYIKKLSPFPGRSFTPVEVRYVIPDIKVERDGNDFIIILNDEAFPVLGISKFYEELGESGTLPADAKKNSACEFARQNVREAQIFLSHLKRRNQTLLRTANALLKFQNAFFLNGPKFLAPLSLKKMADELNLHEATVSRTANGKYIQTEWGIFEIRRFFTASVSSADSGGTEYSRESVKEIIKEIVLTEDRHLSDQEICALLAQRGIALARRTVAKYRKELDMGSSYTRNAGAKKIIQEVHNEHRN